MKNRRNRTIQRMISTILSASLVFGTIPVQAEDAIGFIEETTGYAIAEAMEGEAESFAADASLFIDAAEEFTLGVNVSVDSAPGDAETVIWDEGDGVLLEGEAGACDDEALMDPDIEEEEVWEELVQEEAAEEAVTETADEWYELETEGLFEELVEWETEEAAELFAGVLQNPVITPDDTMDAGQRVTYSCVWFGSYPQAEVVPEGSYAAVDADYLQEGDIIPDSALYAKLQTATWNDQNETVLDGAKYRRMQRDDANTYKDGSFGSYDWQGDAGSFHYFKYEPIKWRVLSINGNDALLLADKALDGQWFHEEASYVSRWDQSQIRSFLNGYNGSANNGNKDYSGSSCYSFSGSAFTESERSAIREEEVSPDHVSYPASDGGAAVNDRIFLLSENEVYSSTAVNYGFEQSKDTVDEARQSRSSSYAKAMGISWYTNSAYAGNSNWWLRSPGATAKHAMYVRHDGYASYDSRVYDNVYAVRPALKINLSTSEYDYAGTVCTNGTVEKIDGGRTEYGSGNAPSTGRVRNPIIFKDASAEAGQKVSYSCVWFGSYPQAEVVPSGEYKPIHSVYLQTGDIIQDDKLYASLNASASLPIWDENNEAVINGNKYRRIRKEDATSSVDNQADRYAWNTDENAETYHYFKYEPIKWRVLSTDGKTALLLSDIGLDDQQYNSRTSYGLSNRWDKSQIRSFLNGYSAGENFESIDYSGKGFYGSAFNEKEQAAIYTETVSSEHIAYPSMNGGATTNDKVFLLADKDLYGTASLDFGFTESSSINDEARRCQTSTYAKAMGSKWNTLSKYIGSSGWWLRSPGGLATNVVNVDDKGGAGNVSDVKGTVLTVRPALRIDLSSIAYSSAGTGCTDGTMEETPGGRDEHEEDSTISQNTIQNPVISPNPNNQIGSSKQKVIYSCVWFGSYPQAEVVPSGPYSAVGDSYRQEGDIIQNDGLYAQLQSATWNAVNETVINGQKFRRMRKSDALYAEDNNESQYAWQDDTTYHYFKYEPIKWRVLNTDGDTAFLLADRGLDTQPFSSTNIVRWDKSEIRSFLNGYDEKANAAGKDYSGISFYGSAFNAAEKAALRISMVSNDHITSTAVYEGVSTYDRVFLLSDREALDEDKAGYGFSDRAGICDEAKRCKATTYAKAMGSLWFRGSIPVLGNSEWWLRSPFSKKNVIDVGSEGMTGTYSGKDVNDRITSVRPAIRIDLSSDAYSYAGTVSSLGPVTELPGGRTVHEAEQELPAENIHNPEIKPDISMETFLQKVTYSCIWFGAYPQSEVVSAAGNGAIPTGYAEQGGRIKDDELYEKLTRASWNSRNETVLDGIKYRRMRKADAAVSGPTTDYWTDRYNWENDTAVYRYFRYDPIKWRVLSTDGNKALLLADRSLDFQRFNDDAAAGSRWDQSQIRSFLNGYDPTFNHAGKDYSQKSFYQSAFNDEERFAICTEAVSPDHLQYPSSEGGNTTNDRVFLLSDKQVFGRGAIYFGFVEHQNVQDEAKRSISSSYAKAMGAMWNSSANFGGNTCWLLRSPGGSRTASLGVEADGRLKEIFVNSNLYAVRPALYIDLSSTEYSYAGTVCTDKVVHEVDGGRKTGTAEQDEETPTPPPGVHTHSFGSWTTVKAATALGQGSESRRCTGCTKVENRVVAKLISRPKLNMTTIPLQVKQSTRLLKVTGLAAGDYVTSYKIDKRKIATVDKRGKIKAKKKGGAILTVTLASGKTVKAKIKVQKGIVKTQKLTVNATKLTLAKRKTFKILAERTPLTSQEKVTYVSSNKKVATVSKKGVIKAIGKGKCKITVKSGRKKKVIRITVN